METADIFNLPYFRPMGRCYLPSAHRAGALPLLWAGSGLELRFDGSELRLLVAGDAGDLPVSRDGIGSPEAGTHFQRDAAHVR